MKTTFTVAFDMSRDICALHVFLNLMGFENEEVEFSSDFSASQRIVKVRILNFSHLRFHIINEPAPQAALRLRLYHSFHSIKRNFITNSAPRCRFFLRLS